MRFCDLFISYKIGLKGIKNLIPFTKLPLHRKIAVVLTFAFSLLAFILYTLHQFVIALIIVIIAFFLLIVFFIIDSRKKNLEHMLQNHYTLYSQKRMNMVINILNDYKIDITDIDSIDLLITEAQSSQEQSDYLAPLKNPLKMLGTIIVPIVVFAAQKSGTAATQDEMITMSMQAIIIVISIFSIIISITAIAKDIFYRDYNKYNDLISDLKQVKIFYSKQ
jgi:hypothetical protein